MNVKQKIVGSKRKDHIGARSLENLKALKMLPGSQKKDLYDQTKFLKN